MSCKALKLSQNIYGGSYSLTPRSLSKNVTQATLVVVAYIALYSASVLDPQTVFFFLEHQEMHVVPKNTQTPMVDFLVSRQPAQFASLNIVSLF